MTHRFIDEVSGSGHRDLDDLSRLDVATVYLVQLLDGCHDTPGVSVVRTMGLCNTPERVAWFDSVIRRIGDLSGRLDGRGQKEKYNNDRDGDDGERPTDGIGRV